MNFYTRTPVNDLNVNLIAISGESVDKMNFNKIKLEPLNNNHLSTLINLKSSKFLEDSSDSYQLHRIENLEKAIQFLQSQHQEVLANLHEEIDALKQQNRGLQLQIAKLGLSDSIKGLNEETNEGLPVSINSNEKSLLKSRIIALEKALKEETSKNKEFLTNLRRKNVSSEFMDNSVNKTKFIEVGNESDMLLDTRASYPPSITKDLKFKQKKLKLTSAETYVDNSNRQHKKDLESAKIPKVYNSVKSNDVPNISKDNIDQSQMSYDRTLSRNSICSDKPILKLPPIYMQPKNQ